MQQAGWSTTLGTWALAGALVLAGCHGRGGGKADQATASPQPVLAVRVAPAGIRTMEDSLAVTGAIAPWQAIPVSPAANGLQVFDVRADEGQHVRKGQVLAMLDNRMLQAQAADARARLSTALANAKDAQYNYDRYRALRAEGGVTGPEMSQRAAALASANGSVAQARAALAQVQVQVSQTQVVAPTDGLILTRSVQIGDVAAVGKAMFTLARNGRLEMDGNVAEADLGRVRVGQSATVGSDAVPGLKAVGSVIAISPSLNTTSRLAVLRIALPADSGFRVGMFATATIRLGRRAALAVPSDAVTNREGRTIVFVVGADNVVHARPVVTGDPMGGWTPVTEGVKVGDRVVTDGVGFLKEGDLVTVSGVAPSPQVPGNRMGSPAPAPSRAPAGPAGQAAPAPQGVQPSSGAPVGAPPPATRPSMPAQQAPSAPGASAPAPQTFPSVAPSQGPVGTIPSTPASMGARAFEPTAAPSAITVPGGR